jgi:putative oxidoreductase
MNVRKERNTNLALLFLRIGGALMLLHGWPKMMNYSEYAEKFPDPVGFGAEFSLLLTVFAEVFCTVFVALGLFTRFATIPLMITMLVAALIVHSGDPFGDREASIGYFLLYAAIFFLGGGKYSLDNVFRKAAKW